MLSGRRGAMALVPRNETWDLEYDIYFHLQKKTKLLASATDEKLNYFSALVEQFHAPDTRVNTAQETVQFMDGLYSTVRTLMHHLPEASGDDTAEEENCTGKEEEDDDGVIEDPRYKLFLDHLRPDGNFYVLEITEDSVFVRYHHESLANEALAVCEAENANHVSNEANNVGLNKEMHPKYKGKRRGRKPKGSRKRTIRNSNNSGNGVASSEAQKHDSSNKGRRRGRPRKHDTVNGKEVSAMKTAFFDKSTDSQTIGNKTKDNGIATEVKVEIEDYDDDVQDATHIIRPVQEPMNLEYYWHDNKANARKLSEYREKLMQELKKPYCQEEYERLFKDISFRKPVQRHKVLRNTMKTYEEDYLGKSLLDHNFDLAREIDSVRDDHARVLNLLRGFFYWLKNLSDEDAFMPWRDSYYLDVLPHQ